MVSQVLTQLCKMATKSRSVGGIPRSILSKKMNWKKSTSCSHGDHAKRLFVGQPVKKSCDQKKTQLKLWLWAMSCCTAQISQWIVK